MERLTLTVADLAPDPQPGQALYLVDGSDPEPPEPQDPNQPQPQPVPDDDEDDEGEDPPRQPAGQA